MDNDVQKLFKLEKDYQTLREYESEISSVYGRQDLPKTTLMSYVVFFMVLMYLIFFISEKIAYFPLVSAWTLSLVLIWIVNFREKYYLSDEYRIIVEESNAEIADLNVVKNQLNKEIGLNNVIGGKYKKREIVNELCSYIRSGRAKSVQRAIDVYEYELRLERERQEQLERQRAEQMRVQKMNEELKRLEERKKYEEKQKRWREEEERIREADEDAGYF